MINLVFEEEHYEFHHQSKSCFIVFRTEIMGIVMRIIQQYDPCHENEFMALEKKFDELEKKRPDYPKGKRMQPISAGEPINTLIWQYEFPDIETAYKILDFFNGDEGHEELFRQQVPFMKQVKVEFYKTLDF